MLFSDSDRVAETIHSRENHPKFLLDVNLCGRSLLQSTWDRLIPLSSPARTTVVAGPAHSSSIIEQIPDLDSQNLFIEPGPKDSMAAIGLAAAVLARRDPDAVIGSFAADHMISGADAFLSAVAEAVDVARNGYLVTIGIAPSHPATAFGYVRLGESLNLPNAPNARLVGSFKEKPDARTAATYLATGSYRWNAGMFVTRASLLLELLKEYKPELYEGLERIADSWADEESRKTVLQEVWPTLEKIPIDNAVAEPAAAQGRVAVVPATFGWDDVGDFSSLSEMLPAERNQPKILGDNRLGTSSLHSSSLSTISRSYFCSLDGAGRRRHRRPRIRPPHHLPRRRRPRHRRYARRAHGHHSCAFARSQAPRQEGEGLRLEESVVVRPSLILSQLVGIP